MEELQKKVLDLSNDLLYANTSLQECQETLRMSHRDNARLKSELASSESEIAKLATENRTLTQRVRSMEDELADLSSSLVDEANQQVSEANRRAAAINRLVEERDDVIASQSAELVALKELLEVMRSEELRMSYHGDGLSTSPQFSPHVDSPQNRPAAASGSTQPAQIGSQEGTPQTGTQPWTGTPQIGPQNGTSQNGTPQNGTQTGSAQGAVHTPQIGTSISQGGSPAFSPWGVRTASPRLPSSRAGSNSLRRVSQDVQGEITQALILDLDAYASPTRPLIRTDLPDFRDFCDLWGCEFEGSEIMSGLASARFFHLSQTSPWRRNAYVQRVIKEDIYPTLHVDKSPHLSYLTMRAFTNSVLDVTIALDPVTGDQARWARRPSQPCLLCGENRGEDKFERIFWARVPRETTNFVMDLACVAKTRLACELSGFLRDVARRPPASEAAKRVAWRQCNSMREQLFWARTGGLFPDNEELLAAIQYTAQHDFSAAELPQRAAGRASQDTLRSMDTLPSLDTQRSLDTVRSLDTQRSQDTQRSLDIPRSPEFHQSRELQRNPEFRRGLALQRGQDPRIPERREDSGRSEDRERSEDRRSEDRERSEDRREDSERSEDRRSGDPERSEDPEPNAERNPPSSQQGTQSPQRSPQREPGAQESSEEGPASAYDNNTRTEEWLATQEVHAATRSLEDTDFFEDTQEELPRSRMPGSLETN